jgi:hypothetical protein
MSTNSDPANTDPPSSLLARINAKAISNSNSGVYGQYAAAEGGQVRRVSGDSAGDGMMVSIQKVRVLRMGWETDGAYEQNQNQNQQYTIRHSYNGSLELGGNPYATNQMSYNPQQQQQQPSFVPGVHTRSASGGVAQPQWNNGWNPNAVVGEGQRLQLWG